MPPALRSLDALVSGMSTDVRMNGYGTGAMISFTNRLGETVSIVPGEPYSTRYLKLGDRQDSNDASEGEGGVHDGDFDSFLASTMRREELRHAYVNWRLEIGRPSSRQHMPGHHAGGYHPGKNRRQNLSVAVVDGKLSDLEIASRLLGFPTVTLVATCEVIGRLEEQRSYEVFAGSRAVSGGNGHHNGYKA